MALNSNNFKLGSLHNQIGSPEDLAYYTQQIVVFHKDRGYITELQNYVNTLPGYNLTAFNDLSLFLLRYYHRMDNTASIQLVRDGLLSNNPNNINIEYEVKFFDLQGRLGKLLAGNGVTLSATDSTDLAQIASSGTAHWLEACMAIKHHYPQLICNNGYNYKSEAHEGQVGETSYLGQAYPNPAENTATISYTIPSGINLATLRIGEVATGRVIREVLLNLKAEQVQVDLSNISSGLYTYTLLLNGVPNATKKLVVIK